MEVMDRKAKQIGYDSYAKYLKSKHWQRQIELHRRGACFCCFGTESLQLHHIDYERIGKELATDLVTACDSCHQSIHRIVRSKRSGLASAHFLLRDMISKDRCKTGRQKGRWVTNWRQLVNKSKKQTIAELEEFLVNKGLASVDSGHLEATELAFLLRFTQRSNDGKLLWNLDKYIEMMKSHRKLEKCIMNGIQPHPALLKRALAR